jgi:hypothetical protein
MRSLAAALTSHLAGGVTTLAVLWRVIREDAQEFGFTSHSSDIPFGGLTYAARTGVSPSAIESQTRLAVTNLEQIGAFDSAAITEDDLNAGLWDHARVEVYVVNWQTPDTQNEPVNVGYLGEVKREDGKYSAEIRGLADAYSQTLGEVYSPSCRAKFGDARCGLALSDYTVTGTVETVDALGIVLTDSTRTEPGPTGGVAITGISKATTPTITAVAHGFIAGQVVYISQVLGMTEINGRHVVVLATPTDNTFTAYGVDTTDFTTYTSGGTATPQGDVGTFDYGLLTMTSGASSGFAMEVKAYDVGTITLMLPLPYGVEVGDTYEMSQGCGKRFLEDCVERYANGVNFRGEPHVPGMDRLQRVGGQA